MKIVGLCKGDKATLVIPPDIGYGPNHNGAVGDVGACAKVVLCNYNCVKVMCMIIVLL